MEKKNINFVHHSNNWLWGRSVIIVSRDGYGVVTVSYPNDEEDAAYIHGLSVFELKRELGYGNALLTEAEDSVLLNVNVKHIFISAEHEWIVEWYKRRGYVFDHEEDGLTTLRKDMK